MFFSVNCFLWPIQWLCNLRNAQWFYLFDMKRMERDIFIYTITYAHVGFCRNFFGSRKWSWTLVSWTYRVGAPRSETSVGLEHVRPNVMFSLFNYIPFCSVFGLVWVPPFKNLWSEVVKAWYQWHEQTLVAPSCTLCSNMLSPIQRWVQILSYVHTLSYSQI